MKKVLFAGLLLGLSFTANAQRDNSGTFEWSISGIYQDSKSMSSENGSSLEAKSAVGLGLNINYYLSNRFLVGFDMEFLSPGYKAILIDDTVVPADSIQIKHNMSQFNGRFKATYEFLDGNFKPFVEGGLGWSYFDSNVADSPPIVGCWWHPYWGYICDGYYRTITETVFTYGVGAGIKYQLSGDSFLKLSFNSWKLDGIGKAGDENLDATKLEYGWRF